MTIKDYQIFKRINPRITSYKRKEDDENQFVAEFFSAVENRKVLENVLKKINEEEMKTEIIEVKNAKVYFKIIANRDFFKKLFEKVF